ncbi:ABC transporter ATP-binding protein [Desertimonas flava]|jgi:branched-chain amino acid transport system ATP-binding protein|uniref:ABC transporter ATP-binding protein n=1 Tax=Desertimonas flava TaxID=2064846 RepID=UPI000E352897|nr:ABC transporter ATP-binding protein [Desertimonas flava]
MELLEVRGLCKRFGGLQATYEVDLTVREGTAHSIIGPNGAGKSTLLNLLIGLIRPDSGTVMLAGTSLLGRRPHEINQLGVARVFQTPSVFPDMSLLDNVTIAALAARDGDFRFNLFQHPSRRRDAVAAAEDALLEVGLDAVADVSADDLSHGDKRRLELAICLAHRPRLLLLDEPTQGMSQLETQSTVELLRRLVAKGMTKVIIEHDMKVVFGLSDEITVLHQGCVIATGEPDAVRHDEAVLEAYLGGVEL